MLSIDHRQHWILGSTDCECFFFGIIILVTVHIIRSRAKQRSMRNQLACQLGTQRCMILPISPVSSHLCQVTQDTLRLDMGILHHESFKFIHPAMDVVQAGSVIMTSCQVQDNHDHLHWLTMKLLSPHRHSISLHLIQVEAAAAHVCPLHLFLKSQAGLHILIRMKNEAVTESLSNHLDISSRQKGLFGCSSFRTGTSSYQHLRIGLELTVVQPSQSFNMLMKTWKQ